MQVWLGTTLARALFRVLARALVRAHDLGRGPSRGLRWKTSYCVPLAARVLGRDAAVQFSRCPIIFSTPLFFSFSED